MYREPAQQSEPCPLCLRTTFDDGSLLMFERHICRGCANRFRELHPEVFNAFAKLACDFYNLKTNLNAYSKQVLALRASYDADIDRYKYKVNTAWHEVRVHVYKDPYWVKIDKLRKESELRALAKNVSE